MAALTMTVGNVLALLQSSVKRMLAYSSVAHSGYMLVGLVVGPGLGTIASNGLGATLFYLLCYGVMTLGAFAALAALERRGVDGERVEVDTFDEAMQEVRGHCDIACLTRSEKGSVIVAGDEVLAGLAMDLDTRWALMCEVEQGYLRRIRTHLKPVKRDILLGRTLYAIEQGRYGIMLLDADAASGETRMKSDAGSTAVGAAAILGRVASVPSASPSRPRSAGWAASRSTSTSRRRTPP